MRGRREESVFSREVVTLIFDSINSFRFANDPSNNPGLELFDKDN